jgi:methyltransferase (TIGR00027 family)
MSGPSRTALTVALLRAAHRLVDRPLVFDDPLALGLAGPEGVRLVSQPERCRALVARAFIAARSRWAEDELAGAIARGVTQYVILGAGLDSYAYRAPPPGLRIYEVDRPASLAWKRERLHEAGLQASPLLSYVANDLETGNLASVLGEAGFRAEAPAFFSLLGLAVTLSRAALFTVLEFVGARPQGSAVVLDYGDDAAGASEAERAEREHAVRGAARVGEPLCTFLGPSELRGRLLGMGFVAVGDLDTEAANARYFASRADGLSIPKSGRRLLGARR